MMMIIEGGSTEGGVLPLSSGGFKHRKSNRQTNKQADIHIFQKYHVDSRQVCGEEVFLGWMPGLEAGR